MRLAISLLAFTLLPTSLHAQISAVERTDENSQTAHAQLVEKARQGRVDLYFSGDSITRRWGTSDEQYRNLLDNWNENFFGWNAGNFAWGGDRVQHILWRLQNGELDGVNPKVIVHMAGTNNLGRSVALEEEATKIEEVVGGTRAIIDVMQQKAPGAPIILMGITPRNGRDGNTAVVPVINKINERLATFADGDSIRYVNINDQLADADGKLYEGMAVDGLHLDVKGYQVWADAIKPILTELLGPPAATDQAPPPTGNPAAQRN